MTYARVMVSIGAAAPARPRLSLAALLAERDASIAARPSMIALAGLRAKRSLRSASSAIGRTALFLIALLATFVQRHGLVLAGLAAFTLAAWQYGMAPGLITGGAAAFFLELRRR